MGVINEATRQEILETQGLIAQLKNQLADEKQVHRGERYRLEIKIANLRKEVKRLLKIREDAKGRMAKRKQLQRIVGGRR